ncbi:replication protein [Peribacillus saganii]|uniref:Replication protein n=1 Tax=Peribacillus saganii TaxID=2303992 RepID=A0A372LCF1_9BACI|nr:conserved phage C-terminal domain-containing protein [Peribacillus saganii]RFU63685.1 replication protein [Peribacillus saganii]
MSGLLIKESPLMIIPSLAVKIGLSEAVILQQVHYWLKSSKHEFNGRKWIYNTYKDWQNQLTFWSESTIKRTIKKLEKDGYLISGNWNRSKMDKTKWYTIDYEKLMNLEEELMVHPAAQNEPLNAPDADMEEPVLDQAIPEITQETTAENKIPYAEIIAYLNEKTNSCYKASTQQTRNLIRKRWKEGFILEDFKRVIDQKATEWKNPQWSKYLRPETLFGTKFESYLNQRSFGSHKVREEDFDLDD